MTCPATYTVPVAKGVVTGVLKRLIARKKGIANWHTGVLLKHRLREDLRFTDAGVRALTPDLNDCFRPLSLALTPGEVGRCRTVEDLAWLIWNAVSEEFKTNR
ncbi:MAG: hypothetical protein K9G39_04355 [Chlorobium sp.]|uniref:hypothetical protein n=1 Tax=Chlorobium sp. TaxID=1095 RepID=UPI0025C0E0E4|nr:hypothetical protein [Chlorobium sp.]MCF8382814.1 hypothetical protein [Chlorobium sp.]